VAIAGALASLIGPSPTKGFLVRISLESNIAIGRRETCGHARLRNDLAARSELDVSLVGFFGQFEPNKTALPAERIVPCE
jgi:hypothetical protein